MDGKPRQRLARQGGTGKPRALVLGGGVAGMSAACALSERFNVTLIEKRPFLGGRVYSMPDAKTGDDVDNAQHVFLGCFERLRAFFQTLGMEEEAPLQKKFALRMFFGSGEARKEISFKAASLPAPFHLAPALLRMSALSWGERFSIARAMEKIRRLSDDEAQSFAGANFGEWLRRERQGENAIRLYWDFFALAALNAHADDCDASAAFFVFRNGLMKSEESSRVGYLLKGQDALARAARRHIEARGGRVLAGAAAASLRVERGRVVGVELAAPLADGTRVLEADVYVSALPPEALYALVPASLKNLKPFLNLPRLSGSPIVGVHLWYDRPVVNFDFAGFPGHPLQWVFNKSKIFGLQGSGQYLSVVLSAAKEWVDAPKEDAVRAMDGHIRAWFPEAREAALLRSRVVKEPFATLLPFPGYDALRPSPRTGLPNFILAGEWTATGWPSSMESAVRSGEAAAREAEGMV